MPSTNIPVTNLIEKLNLGGWHMSADSPALRWYYSRDGKKPSKKFFRRHSFIVREATIVDSALTINFDEAGPGESVVKQSLTVNAADNALREADYFLTLETFPPTKNGVPARTHILNFIHLELYTAEGLRLTNEIEAQRKAEEARVHEENKVRAAPFLDSFRGATVKEIQFSADNEAVVFFTDGRRFPEQSGFFLDGTLMCHCPCRCGWTNEALGPTGVCQSCSEGHHEIPPEGVPFNIPELVKLLTSYTEQCKAEDDRRRGIQRFYLYEQVFGLPGFESGKKGTILVGELREKTGNTDESIFALVVDELHSMGGHITETVMDQWYLVSAESHDRTFCASIECDDLDFGLAGIWRAFKRHECIKAVAVALPASIWVYNKEEFSIKNIGIWTLVSDGQVIEKITLNLDGCLCPDPTFATGALLDACLAAGFELPNPQATDSLTTTHT